MNITQMKVKPVVCHVTSLINLTLMSLDSKGKEAAALKADLLRARNMKRYINQLTVAKKQCEKRIRLLGGPNYEQQEDGAQDDGDGPQSQRVRVCSTFTGFISLSLCVQ